MANLGAKVAFVAVREGTPVYDARGDRIGVVEEMLADRHAAIFEGVLIHTVPLPGRHVVADVGQIESLHERGVVLSVDRTALREASGDRRAPSDGANETLEHPLQARLRHIWDRITGSRIR